MELISKERSYLSKKDTLTLLSYKACLGKISENFLVEAELKTQTPIFLDANVLLRYYSISFAAREKLLDFIRSNVTRIIISSQVQFEFVKNREDVIQRFFEQVTSKIPKEFDSKVVNSMKSFLDDHKTVLKDYPFVEGAVRKYRIELENSLNRLNEAVEMRRKEYQDLTVRDEFLDLLANCILLEPLSIEELKVIRGEFDILKKDVDGKNVDTVLNKAYLVFPGYGDIKKKPEYPYGDYIIFHEIMKYIANNNTEVIFLTFDTTKGDWMTKSKSPHLHYMQNMYENTGQIFYILDAERTLETLLNVNVDSLVSTNTVTENSTGISIESLQNFLDEYFGSSSTERGTVNNLIVNEVLVNGYNSIEEIKSSLDKSVEQAYEYTEDNDYTFNYIGMLRACLRIVDPTYKVYRRAGEFENLTAITKNKFKKYHNRLKF